MTQLEVDYMRTIVLNLPKIADALERIADAVEQKSK